jgi:hypothetical protein
MEAITPDHLALQDWYVRENRDCINAMCTRDENAAWLQKSRQEKRKVASALVLQAINSNKGRCALPPPPTCDGSTVAR